MIYAISKRGEREVLLEFRNWAEHADYIDNGGNAYVITEEWARQWVLDGKGHETGLPGIDDALPADSYEPYFPYVHAAEQPAAVTSGSRVEETSKAMLDVSIERYRQILKHGWTAEHDDQHRSGELALAAGWYALNSPHVGAGDCVGIGNGSAADKLFHDAYSAYCWPFDLKWWKPKNQRQDLVRAAALIIAEIERLDRAEARQ